MPWKESTLVSLRNEFVLLARAPGANVSEICRRSGISRKTGYKWLGRAAQGEDLANRSHRPRSSPRRTAVATEARLLTLREQTTWGGRKLHHVLEAEGVRPAPAPSTITGILARNGLLAPERREKRDWQRFEAEAPNRLWQMDFKGHFAAGKQRCHPLTILDDHSRFNLCLQACANEQMETVQAQLTRVFERYGLPERILADNGPPWGTSGQGAYTSLGVWLIRRGVSVSHGRPLHPQTQGKEERFHRSLLAEVVRRRPVWHDFAELQAAFDAWRDVYNFKRPHEGIGMTPPASRYQPSPRSLPAVLLPVEYDSGDEIRLVRDNGRIKFRGRLLPVGKAFRGEPVALRPIEDGRWDVYYCHDVVALVDLTVPLAEV